MIQLLTFEDIATEIVMTLCSAIGLVLAVPITSAIAVLLAPSPHLDGAAGPRRRVRPAPDERRPRTPQAPSENEMLRPLDWEF